MDTRDEELADLIARCSLRDQLALKMLYDRIGGYLNAVIFRILKSEEIANEVLQEALIQIWENAGSYRSHLAKPLTWITSIARYRALDRLEKEKRYAQRFQSDDEIVETFASDEQSTPHNDVQNTQLNQQIHKCLDLLNEQVRGSIKLAYLEGFSRDQIAERLGTKTNTVKSWLRRGAERLKQCLETKI